MARSLLLVMVLVVVFFLALVPAPSVGQIAAAIGKIGSYSVRLHPERVTKQLRNVGKKHAGDIIDVVQETMQQQPFGDKKEGADDKPPERAANTAGLYIFNLSVGTQAPQDVAGVLDVTRSFVWAQCESCTSCLAAPSFRPTASPSFAAVPCASQRCPVAKQVCRAAGGDANCGYTVNYRGGTNTTGYLASDTFTFGGPTTSRVAVPGVLFGCSVASYGNFSGASGSFGFGRGPLSLVSQLKLSWFSYLLATDGSGSGGGAGGNLLQFGDDAVPRSSRGRSTPLVSNMIHPGLYYVMLKGIQVDGRDLTGIPAGTFDLQANGSGGVVLSTTTPVTYLEEAAYKVLRRAFFSGIAAAPVDGSALGLDLCYAMSSVDDKQLKVPKLTLVFDDGGATSTSTPATMELKKSNYFFADRETGLECLTIMPSRGGSVLGSLLQTDTKMTYDISGGQLVFERQLVFDTAFAPPHHSKVSVLSPMVLAPLLAWMLLF